MPPRPPMFLTKSLTVSINLAKLFVKSINNSSFNKAEYKSSAEAFTFLFAASQDSA
jgi:hypothetical protein